MSRHTKGRVGVGRCGTMLVTPPPAEALERIKGGKLPFTSRRICVCEPSHYTPEPEAKSNARRLAAAWNAVEGVPTEALEAGVVAALIAASKALLASKEQGRLSLDSSDAEIEAWLRANHERWQAFAAAVARMEAPNEP